MIYPTISEYVEAIKGAEDNFDLLRHLRPVLDAGGNPVMSSGNFAVVFKMRDADSGKLFALKCFTREQDGRNDAYRSISAELSTVNSPYLTNVKYFDKELFVDTSQSGDTEFPVLLMDWVDGVTLDKYIRANIDNEYALGELAYQFSCMAQWLLGQPFAHGDLKPDNILVRDDGSLVLVDYDGMYVPAMSGQAARELGSPDYRHPDSTTADFDKRIDDFAIITILLSLKAIAVDPSLLERYGAPDRLLLSRADYHDYSRCALIKEIYPSPDGELNRLVSLLTQAIYTPKSLTLSPELLKIKPVIDISNLSTEVTDEDLANAWTDEYGVKYSADRKRLLKAPKDIKTYTVRKGTLVICDSAFGGYLGSWYPSVKLKSISIPSTVILIGIKAFAACTSLTSIELPSSVTSIGNSAFCYCTSLTSIEIPSSLTSLGEGVFGGCDKLMNINNLSNNIELINGILYNKTKDKILLCLPFVERVSIPSSVTSIGAGAFSECSSLTSIEIPSSVTSIGESAFCGCSSLTSIKLPPSVTSIGDSAFRRCCCLTSIELPSSLTSIEEWAFDGCSSLMSIELPSSLTSIGDNAFWGCSSLTSIKLPSSLTSIRESAFGSCSRLTSIELPSSLTSIGKSAFSGCSSLTSIKLPSSLMSIGDCAFLDCTSLTSIELPSSLTNIGDRAFERCTSLTSIELPSLLTSIGCRVFSGCSSLMSIELPSSVSSIGTGAFEDCSSLTSIKLPSSLTNIGDRAFERCTSLTSIELPSLLTSIGCRVFSGCSSLMSIELPSSVSSIGTGAFEGCSSLTSIKLPSSLTSIGYCAFERCSSLMSIELPPSLTSLGAGAFLGCDKLKKIINLSNNFELINGILYNKSLDELLLCLPFVEQASIFSSVTRIGAEAFSCCRSLTSIVIPTSVTSIGYGAFSGCSSLTSIELPSSVTGIGRIAFSGCSSLTQILVPEGSKHRFKKLLPRELHDKLSEVVLSEVSVIQEHKYNPIRRVMLSDAELAVVARCYISKRVNQENGEEFAILYMNFSWEENGVIKEAYLQERVSKDGELMAGCKVDPSYLGKFSVGDTDVDPSTVCIETRKHKETGVTYKRVIFKNRAEFMARVNSK